MKLHLSSIYIVVATVLLSSCSQDSPETTAAIEEATGNEITLNAEQVKRAGIEISRPVKRVLSEELKATGQLGLPPANQQRVSIPLGGWIVRCDLLPGSHVQKGEVLLVVKSPQYLQIQQEYLEILASLPYLKSERDRQESLLGKEIASKKEFEKAEAEYLGARAKRSGLESKLRFIGMDPNALAKSLQVSEQISIRSQIHGYVGDIHARVGDYMNENESVMEILDLSHLHVELRVFEKDINRIELGQKLEVTINHSGKPVEAEIYLIGKSLSEDKTVDVHCHLFKEEENYLPGMYAEAKIAVHPDSVWTIPKTSLHLRDGEQNAFILVDSSASNYRFKMVPVKSGLSSGEFTSIEADSTLLFVTKGSFALLSGLHNTEEEE